MLLQDTLWSLVRFYPLSRSCYWIYFTMLFFICPDTRRLVMHFGLFQFLVAQNANLPTPTVSSEMLSIFQCLFLLKVMQGFLKLPGCSCWSENFSGCSQLLISKGNVIPGSTSTLSWSAAFPKAQHLCQRQAHVSTHRFLWHTGFY